MSRLLELTLGSILHQTSDNFLVFVACHEVPDLRIAADERLKFIQADFPAPTKDDSPHRLQVDKYDKLTSLMVEAGKTEHSHVMFVDSDDLVSRKLVDFAHRHPESSGWIFRDGFRYSMGSRFILEQRGNFDCGTNSIVNSSTIYYPKSMSPDERSKCLRLTAGHPIIAEKMAEQGTPLQRLPFPGSVYTVNNGENWSNDGRKARWRELVSRSYWSYLRGRWRWLSRRIRDEFALPAQAELNSISRMQ